MIPHQIQSPSSSLLFPPKHPFQVREFRIYKRRKLKPNPNPIRSQFKFSLPFDNLLHKLSSHFPPDFLSSALVFAAGSSAAAAATSFSNTRLNPNPRGNDQSRSDIGEWILFTSPTPFNRFVFLRCPSVSIEGTDLLEDVSEKLVKENRHFVRLDSGRMSVEERREGEKGEELVYQRVCIGTEDGGVVSLDWPANLDLKEERGLDSTLLLVPGTPQGSMDERVRGHVRYALRRGFFPIVMNPRGCAGSPLTTARLFTAADSDDISTAIQFITKSRPWTTMMGVGWGFGANMLTKYLAEVGERTPLTAATCINNPFDLEEATRSTYHIAIDKMLTSGLIDILRANKELFQGRTKGFDVERALLAKSIRDFDEAVSMVSYGYEAIEDFYSKSSTRNLVGNVKIPVLFIQNDDGTVPLFSIPQSTIAENPYTSLLLCSSLPSDISVGSRSALPWCQQLSIEWLTAVELGLLKGRHPLLKDIDITINPVAGLSLMEKELSNKSGKGSKYLELTNGYSLGLIKDGLDGGDASASDIFQFKQNRERDQEDGREVQESGSVDAQLVDEEATERGEVLQTAQVVMNMLDVTMPGTLTEEDKRKVLSAVGQGETLMKALQNAVPEDVCGKLTTTVSEILSTQGTKLKFDGILDIGHKVGSSSGVNPTFQENLGGNSSTEGLVHDNHSSDQIHSTDTSVDTNLQRDTSVSGQDSDIHSPEKSNSYEDKDNGESGNNNDVKESSNEKPPHSNLPRAERTDGGEEATSDEYKEDENRNVADVTTKEDSEKNQERSQDSSIEQKKEKVDSSIETQSPSGSPSEPQIVEKKNNDNQNREDKTIEPISAQNKSITPEANSPTFSVSQALDALTGLDDSTQMAVNSVFGVLEDVITQLEEASDNESEDKDMVKNGGTAFGSKEPNITNVEEIKKQEVCEDADLKHHYSETSGAKGTNYGIGLEKPDQNCMSVNQKCNGDLEGKGKSAANLQEKRDESRVDLVNNRIMDSKFDLAKQANTIPLFTSLNPYGTSLYDEYIHRYYVSKIPAKSLDKDTMKALLLDYFPEEGQYKLLEGPGNTGDTTDDLAAWNSVDRKINTTDPSSAKTSDNDDIIEPSYVVLDAGKRLERIREYETKNKINTVVNKTEKMVEDKAVDFKANRMKAFVKKIILACLKIEVERRLSLADMKEMKSNLAGDFEQVAIAVCSAVGLPKEYSIVLESGDHNALHKLGIINGDLVISAISTAVNETHYLKRVLPLGVIVGSSLAALREYFDVSTMNDNVEAKTSGTEVTKSGENMCSDVDADLIIPLESLECSYNRDIRSTNLDDLPSESADENVLDDSSRNQEENVKKDRKNSDAVMVSVVTAALGTSAFLVHQQELDKSSSEEGGTRKKESDKLADPLSDKDQNNIVTSLAEKAISVAGPIVPTTEDGEVDHERLVAMLADLGQRGGMLRLVGKVALLWGGFRGAMSLTDKLISFLRIAERPLYQRIIGFTGMVLVIWSPVVIPLLPMLVQSRMTKGSFRFAEVACIIGLYAAILILVIMWGKRIREYEEPLKKYGLDLTSSKKIQEFLMGLIGGVVLIASIQCVNFSLGFVTFSWPQSLSSSSLDAVTRLKVCGEVLVLIGRAFLTATAVAFVEEVLFRSWLYEEIAADIGYHQAIVLSGLAFSLLQRSPWAIPGLWLLSISLAGLRHHGEGSLSIPIGFRAGILASSYILQTGGYLIYKPSFPLWVTGPHAFQPFSGVVGLTFSLVLAILFYPRQPTLGK